MGSLERRLERLEAERKTPRFSKEALRRLSDEDLDALEEAVEAGVRDGHEAFEDLYRAVGERSRRALDALLDAHEAVSRGEESPSLGSLDRDYVALHERIAAGDEEARREYQSRNGYRIWKYRTQ